jgi:hypothetical protein
MWLDSIGKQFTLFGRIPSGRQPPCNLIVVGLDPGLGMTSNIFFGIFTSPHQ